MRLGLWLTTDACEDILAKALAHFILDPHILSSLQEALQMIMQRVYLMVSQSINLCLTIERALAPTILKAVNQLLDQVLEVGLDHYLSSNTEQQGLKKYKNQISEHQVILNEYTLNGSQLL